MVSPDSFVGAGFDALPARVAILDGDGEIVYTNESWDAFGDTQGLPADAGGVGTNYLAACENGADTDGTDAAAGIRSVADGERDSFSLEYPCHTPSDQSWFAMEAAPYRHDGEQYVLVMHVEITERRRLEQQAREQAERMESFATLLSHDLRNPLAVAMAQAETLALERDGDTEEVVESTTLTSSLERMEAIIDDALVLVKTDAVDDPDAVPLGDAADEAWSNVRTGDATISIVDSPTIRADRSLLGHLLENLFGNAMEHAGPAPTVEVGSLERAVDDRAASERGSESHTNPIPDGRGKRDGAAGFYVEDGGPGIPPADHDRVFESGYTTNTDGSGFGLAIVERVVDAHDWTVAVTDGTDGGARFEIRNVEYLERE